MSRHKAEILKEMRSHAERIFRAAVGRVDPCEAVRRFVRTEGEKAIVGREGQEQREFDLARFDHVFVAGAGKATAPMAKALEEVLGERIHGGLINVKYGFTAALRFIETVEAGHPLPDENGVQGTRRIIGLLRGAGERDLVFSLISGGGSALLPSPAEGITLAQKQAVTRGLLECGASIDEINAVRKHISLSKGGQLARAASPATVINLMLSDVVGDRMDVIASGPFVPDTATFEGARAILEKYCLLENVPASVRDYIERGMQGKAPETPKAGEPVFDRVHNLVIGSNILALQAAEEEARKIGYRAMILSSMIEGEAREVARVHTGIAREVLERGYPIPPPACIISGGETTVTIRGKGLGGRNQEFCLAAAMGLSGLPPRAVILSGGTDGNDGPTDAAGAMVDPFTVKRGNDLGMSADEHLAHNDSYPYFQKTGDLLMTGPTNTNVMDVRLILVR